MRKHAYPTAAAEEVDQRRPRRARHICRAQDCRAGVCATARVIIGHGAGSTSVPHLFAEVVPSG